LNEWKAAVDSEKSNGEDLKKNKRVLVRLAFCKSSGHVHILKTLEEIYAPPLPSPPSTQ